MPERIGHPKTQFDSYLPNNKVSSKRRHMVIESKVKPVNFRSDTSASFFLAKELLRIDSSNSWANKLIQSRITTSNSLFEHVIARGQRRQLVNAGYWR